MSEHDAVITATSITLTLSAFAMEIACQMYRDWTRKEF